MSISSISPTFSGYVCTTHDAILLFQAAITGVLPQVPRRPHDRERAELIQSGSVFIFNEHNSGIKRWTDGIAWSPSRILGNFLIYRQLEKPFSPGEKKRTFRQQRNRRKHSSSVDVSHPYGREGSSLLGQQPIRTSRSDSIIDPTTGMHCQPSSRPPIHSEMDLMKYRNNNVNKLRSDLDGGKTDDRYIVGSLTDTYRFKEDGLVKKTISIQYQGQAYHLVSYYLPDDVRNRSFRTPSNDPRLKDLHVSEELLQTRHFRVALDSEEADPNSQQLVSMGGPSIKREIPQRDVMTSGMSGLGIGGQTSGGGLYGFSGANTSDHQTRGLNMMGRAMDMSYDMDMNNFDHNNYQHNNNLQQQVYYRSSNQSSYQLAGLQQNQQGQQNPQQHNSQSQPHSQLMMDNYGKSNNYVSGYRPFGVAQLPAPQTPNSGLPPPPKVQPQSGQPTPRHTPTSRLATNNSSLPLSISQPDMYQYSSSLQPSYQYATSNNASNPSNGGSAITSAPTSSSRRSSVAAGANSPSLPPMIQSQSYSYSTYGHDYSGTGASSSTNAASDPRRLPGTPSSTTRGPEGDSSSSTSGVMNDNNGDSSHLNGSSTPNQQKLYQVPTTATAAAATIVSTSQSPQGANSYSYAYGNYSSIGNW